MSTIGELLVLLGVNSAPLTAGLAKADAEVKGFGDSVTKTNSAASSSLAGLRMASLAVVGGVAAIGVAAIDMASKFQTSMTTVTNNAHLSAAAAAGIGTAIQQASIGTGASANTMAAALAPVAGELARIQGGSLTAAAATTDLTAAQNLSKVSNVDLGTSLKAIADLMLVYHENASQAGAISTGLYEAQAQLGVGVDTLGSILQRMQPKLAGSGLGLQGILSVVRELEPVIGTGTRAFTTVGTVLQGIVEPSKAASKVLAAVGVSLTDSAGKFIGVPAAIDAIKAAYDRLATPAEKAGLLTALFGKQAQVAAALLAGGSAGLTANATALAANGTAASAAAKVSGDLADQQKVLGADIATAATAIGGQGVDALNGLLASVLPVVDSITQWIVLNPQLTDTILAAVGGVALLVAGVAFLGPILGAIGAVIGIILNPILLIGGAIVALAAAFGLLGPGAQSAFNGVLQTVQNAIPGILAMLLNLGQAFVNWINPLIPGIITQLGAIAGAIVGWITGTLVPFVVNGMVSLAAAFVD